MSRGGGGGECEVTTDHLLAEPPLGIERGLRARAGGGDRLPVHPIGHIARRKDAGHGAVRATAGNEVAAWVHLELALEELRWSREEVGVRAWGTLSVRNGDEEDASGSEGGSGSRDGVVGAAERASRGIETQGQAQVQVRGGTCVFGM